MSTKKGGSENIREKFVNEQLTKEKKLSLWLWIGVGGLGVMIVFFWGYSLWSNLTTANWKKTEENKILKQTGTDWNQVFQSAGENELQNSLTKLQIKELLNNALKQQVKNISATSTTSTIDISTSTTSTINTTTTLTTTSNK